MVLLNGTFPLIASIFLLVLGLVFLVSAWLLICFRKNGLADALVKAPMLAGIVMALASVVLQLYLVIEKVPLN